MFCCQYCGKEFNTNGAKNGHEPYCKNNVNRLSAWNKGLTKETDERVEKYTMSMANTKQSEEYKQNFKSWNKGSTKETDPRIAAATLKMIQTKNEPEWRENYLRLLYEKYGGRHFTQTEEYKENMKNAIFEKYGVYSVMHVPEICKKILDASYKVKPYTMPSGNIVYTQGYEIFALEYILQTHTEQDIEVSFNISTEFYYTFENEIHRYYPDIYVKSENKIIEVKSSYTVTHNKQKNIEKEKCVLDKKMLFEVWLIERDGTIIEKITDYKKYLTER